MIEEVLGQEWRQAPAIIPAGAVTINASGVQLALFEKVQVAVAGSTTIEYRPIVAAALPSSARTIGKGIAR